MIKPTIVISGALASKPRHGGHAWFLLQYLLGFSRLGWAVLFIDRLSAAQRFDDQGRPCAASQSTAVAFLSGLFRRWGLDASYAVLDEQGECCGLERAEVLRRCAESAMLLNVMGYMQDEQILAACKNRVFLDVDPGFGQMWRALGLADIFAGHHYFLSVGTRVGSAGCAVPACGIEWKPTLPPVVLEHWPASAGGSGITSVASWRGAYGPVVYQQKTFGLRVHEFRRFIELPRRLPLQRLEVALDIHRGDERDRDLLQQAGWKLVDPVAAAGDCDRYHRYISQSAAEFCVAKGMYVQSGGGWFSDRSACYLASGKPVIAQETGFSGALPVGEGLLSFATLDEAAQAVESVAADRPRHAAAARDIAVDHLDSDRVLRRLLANVGVG